MNIVVETGITGKPAVTINSVTLDEWKGVYFLTIDTWEKRPHGVTGIRGGASDATGVVVTFFNEEKQATTSVIVNGSKDFYIIEISSRYGFFGVLLPLLQLNTKTVASWEPEETKKESNDER